MPAYKVASQTIVIGPSLDPTDDHYYFCVCTPCATSYADDALNKRGKWQTIKIWNKHRNKASKAGRDRGCFPSHPPIGHIPQLPAYIDVKEDSEDEENMEHRGARERRRQGSPLVEQDFPMAAEDEGMGGHDEFEWTDPMDEQGEGVHGDANGVGALRNGNGDSSVEDIQFGRPSDDERSEDGTLDDTDQEGGDDTEESDDDDESVAASEPEAGYPEADEGALGYERPGVEGSDDGGRDIEGNAEDEQAQFEHHRPHPSDERDVVEPDEQADEDEALAGLIGDIRLAGLIGGRARS
ncbi:hypothetical protein P7C70_g7035, partial [Phenoliferia sp. Uapishka_3]